MTKPQFIMTTKINVPVCPGINRERFLLKIKKLSSYLGKVGLLMILWILADVMISKLTCLIYFKTRLEKFKTGI